MKFDSKRGLWLPPMDFRKHRGFKHLTLMCFLGVILGVAAIGAGPTKLDLATQVKGILPSVNGGTGSTVVGFTGPTLARTFTLPDVNATLEWQANKNAASGYAGLDASSLLTAAQLPTFGSAVKGAVPASGGGTANFLRADGSWVTPPVSTINFIDQAIPTGTLNGVNTAFTTSQPCTPASVMVFRNGLVQTQGASFDYTYSGSTITFNASSIPQSGDPLIYSCRY